MIYDLPMQAFQWFNAFLSDWSCLIRLLNIQMSIANIQVWGFSRQQLTSILVLPEKVSFYPDVCEIQLQPKRLQLWQTALKQQGVLAPSGLCMCRVGTAEALNTTPGMGAARLAHSRALLSFTLLCPIKSRKCLSPSISAVVLQRLSGHGPGQRNVLSGVAMELHGHALKSFVFISQICISIRVLEDIASISIYGSISV